MADVLETLVNAATDAKAAATDITAGFSTVKTDIRGLVANRLNDLFLAVIILGSIWIGHTL